MENKIALAKNYVPLLDEVYQMESVTKDLTGDPSMTRAGANANEIVYPKVSVTGLGDYDRNRGYTEGTVDVEWVTAKFNYDRGTKIGVDAMDNEESYNIAFGRGGAELMRTKVAPEADAFTFATFAGIKGISKGEAKTIDTAEKFMQELLEATNVMDNDEVPGTDRYLYATPALLNGLLLMDTFKSKEILSRFIVKKPVPKTRFYTAIELLSGRVPGEEVGHYRKAEELYEKTKDTSCVDSKTYYTANGSTYSAVASPNNSDIGNYYELVQEGAKEINFMIVHKPAIIKYDKHTVSNIIPAALNPDADKDILKYRKYGIVEVYDNKRAGIYLSHRE